MPAPGVQLARPPPAKRHASGDGLGKQRQCLDMTGTDNTKVPMVERRDLIDAEALRESDHLSVGGAER